MPARLIAVLVPLVLTPGLAACSSSPSTAGRVAVTAGDSGCAVADAEMKAGKIRFAVKNAGATVTEVYVYGQDGDSYSKVMGEVENIGPGTSREMTVALSPGSYEVACKPGQKGDGIRTRITVRGSAGAASEAAVRYDREIELATDGTSITGLSGDGRQGERIEFRLANHAGEPRTLEIKDATGRVVAEAEHIAPDAVGELIVTLDSPGTWQIIVEGEAVADLALDLKVTARS